MYWKKISLTKAEMVKKNLRRYVEGKNQIKSAYSILG